MVAGHPLAWGIRKELHNVKGGLEEDTELIDSINDCDEALKEVGRRIVDIADYLGFSLRDAMEHLYGPGGLYGPPEEDETVH